MAVILAMTYQKKLGLPNYSSHSCSVSLTVEIPDVSVAAQESTKLYALLQTAVDAEIQAVGYMPDASTYGMKPSTANGDGDQASGNGRNHAPRANNGNDDAWRCSEKQQALIEKIVAEHHLDKRDVEKISVEMFGAGVKQLDKLQASGLIDELLDRCGDGRRQAKRPYRRERAPVRGGGA